MVKEKLCKRCNIVKPLLDFHKRSRAKDGHAIYCKKCNLYINKQSYSKFYDKRKSYDNAYDKDRKIQIRIWLEDIKLKYGCANCGYKEYACALDFHHLYGDTKVNNLSSMIYSKHSKIKFIDEVQKCIILCSNCHRLLHNGIITSENMTPCLLEQQEPCWQKTLPVVYRELKEQKTHPVD